MPPRVSVVVPTYNRPHFLRRLLESLVAQDAPVGSFDVLVVSDGSTDGTHAFLEDFCRRHPGFHWRAQPNSGPASARNYGLAHVEGEIVAFTDDDCIADPGWVRAIAQIFEERPDVLGVEGKTVTIEDQVTPFTHQIIGNGACYATCNMAYRRQPLVELGGFDPSFFYGNEDVDLAWRMMKRGPVLFHDQMIIVHPPVPRSLLKFIRHPETYGVIILLYRKHPRQFLMVHKRHPLYIIYLAISLRYFIHELTGYRKLLYREPFTFIKLILGLILQRFWVVFLTPKFILMSLGILKQSRAYT